MEPNFVPFRLPSFFPFIDSVKKKTIRLPDNDVLAKIESSINAVFQNHFEESNQKYVVKCFRVIARNALWINTYPKEALQIAHAAKLCYFLTKSVKIETKIKKIIQDHFRNIIGIIPHDLEIGVENKKIPFKAFLLATHSSYFERMLKGPYTEGIQYRKSLQTDVSKTPPCIYVHETTAYIVDLVRSLLEDSGEKEIKKLSINKLKELCKFIDMTDLGTTLFLKIDKILVNFLLKNPKKVSLYLPLEEYIPSLKRGLQRIMLKDIDIDLAVAGIKEKKIVHKGRLFEGDELRECCLDWFIQKIPDVFAKLKHKIPPLSNLPGNSRSRKIHFLEKFAEIGPYFRKLTQSHSLIKLNQEELIWVLDKVSDQITELDLSESLFGGGELLQKFKHLKKLQIHDGMFLQIINIDKCSALETIDFFGCSRLKEVYVSDFTFKRLESKENQSEYTKSEKEYVYPKDINLIYIIKKSHSLTP